MKKGKLLIIDDNEDILFALNLLLEPYGTNKSGYATCGAHRSFHADFIPDIILLDMNFKRDAIGQEGFYWLEDKEDRPGRGGSFYDCLFGYRIGPCRRLRQELQTLSKPWEKEKLLASPLFGIGTRRVGRKCRNLKTS